MTKWTAILVPLAAWVLAIAGCHHQPTPVPAKPAADGGTSQLPPPEPLAAGYDDIHYRDFNAVDLASVPGREVVVPPGLLEQIEHCAVEPNLSIHSPQRFEAAVLATAQKLGHPAESLRQLPADQAMQLAMTIVAQSLEHFPVGHDVDFLQEYGDGLPIDQYFELGKGDAAQFAAGFIAVFRVIKSRCPSLQNVFVADRDFGDIDDDTDYVWNTIIVAYNALILVSHVDLDAAAQGGSIEAERGVYVPTEEKDFLAHFMGDVGEDARSYALLEELYRTAPAAEKMPLLRRMASTAHRLHDQAKMKHALGELGKMDPLECETFSHVVFFGYQLAQELHDGTNAEALKQRLIKTCPDSCHAKWLSGDFAVVLP